VQKKNKKFILIGKEYGIWNPPEAEEYGRKDKNVDSVQKHHGMTPRGDGSNRRFALKVLLPSTIYRLPSTAFEETRIGKLKILECAD